MKSRVCVLLTLAVLASLTAANPAQSQTRGASGQITISPHAHTRGYGGPSGSDTLFRTTPMPFPVTTGTFSWSSIPCDVPAPFNDVALNFEPDYPGIEDPASIRAFIEVNVTRAPQRFDSTTTGGRFNGTLTTILCQNGELGPRIFIALDGWITEVVPNEVRFVGSFTITGGTGTFRDMTGQGQFRGAFFCIPFVLESEGVRNCRQLGKVTDAAMDLTGSYRDPTVQTA